MLFSISKLFGALTSPATLLVLAIVFALIALSTRRPRLMRAGRWVGGAAVLVLVGLMVLPLGALALAPLEDRFAQEKLPQKVDGILVLAGDESPQLTEARGVSVTGWAGQRYLYLARLARLYPDAPIVLVGTTVPLYPSKALTTRQVIEPVLQDLGLSSDRLVFEEESRNTHENAMFSAKMVKPHANQTWLLVTSAFHMPRAILCFRHEGWTVVPAPSDYLTVGAWRLDSGWGLDFTHQLRLLKLAAHEYKGLLSYRAMGWVDALWP